MPPGHSNRCRALSRPDRGAGTERLRFRVRSRRHRGLLTSAGGCVGVGWRIHLGRAVDRSWSRTPDSVPDRRGRERRGPVSLVARVVDDQTSVPIGDELETRVETVVRRNAFRSTEVHSCDDFHT